MFIEKITYVYRFPPLQGIAWLEKTGVCVISGTVINFFSSLTLPRSSPLVTFLGYCRLRPMVTMSGGILRWKIA